MRAGRFASRSLRAVASSIAVPCGPPLSQRWASSNAAPEEQAAAPQEPSASVGSSSSAVGAAKTATSPEAAVSDSGYKGVAAKDMVSVKAVRMMNRELIDEQVRPERPPEPATPRGWTVKHEMGTGEFWVSRMYENDVGTLEELKVIGSVEIKDPEKTYRQQDGEREEPEHFNFSLFVSKPKKGEEVGGVEFMLTSVDSEIVLDGMAVHSNRADLVVAMTRKKSCVVDKELRYRGPYINELDEDFADEIMNYLDERGVHNTFAEFIRDLAHTVEQAEYEHFLKLIRAFAATRR